MFIKPIEGRRVPDPERGGFLPETGREIVMNQFWQRRMDDGDIVEFTPDAKELEQ